MKVLGYGVGGIQCLYVTGLNIGPAANDELYGGA